MPSARARSPWLQPLGRSSSMKTLAASLRSGAFFLDRLEATAPREVKLHLLGRYSGGSPAHKPAAGGDRAGRARRRRGEGGPSWRRCSSTPTSSFPPATSLNLPEDVLKQRLVGPACALVPGRLPSARAGVARRRRAGRRGQAGAAPRSASPEQLVELATRGYQYTPAPYIRRVVFFPSLVDEALGDPVEHNGARRLRLPDRSRPAWEEAAAPAEVARVYKALGDQGRPQAPAPAQRGPAQADRGAARRAGASRSPPRTINRDPPARRVP